MAVRKPLLSLRRPTPISNSTLLLGAPVYKFVIGPERPSFRAPGTCMADNPLRYQVRTVLGVVDPIGDKRGCKMEEWITLLQVNFIPEG